MESRVEPGGGGRRERNKQRVRDRIYTAALELFSERGYETTTVDDIAQRADVARGTFFNHFRRKEDLIAEWAEQRRTMMTERLELPLSAATTDSASLLQLALGILAQVNEEQRALTETMLGAWVRAGKPLTEDPYTAEVFARIVRTGVQRGEIDRHIDPDFMGDVLRDVYLGALYRWARRSSVPGELGRDLSAILWIMLRGMLIERTSGPLINQGITPAAASRR
ncbi:TetR/AcrR family transcriptional regulator [Nocardia jejuensis]|uniref:TetR/AcrR family transcriptional regulator n=1 Tax=Nocardia jejuensis TaxID=328049 RepID=UPI00082982F4|nr:TetR/AcrR family transcriptional regulator [Nocardia jejuensis]